MDALKKRDQKPVILTRGFGASQVGPVWVDREKHSAADVGDEPLLLAKYAPVMVARDRAQGLQAIALTPEKFDVVIMDDGLQNPSVNKDLSIAVVDGRRGFGNAKVIPAGPLRAPLSVQALRVAAVVVNQGALPDAGGSMTHAIASGLRAHGFDGPVIGAKVSVPSATVSLQNARVLAYAGIGNPERFFETVCALGADLVEQRVFADHHEMCAGEAHDLLKSAVNQDLTLVTTEKDWLRITGHDDALKKLKAASRVVPIVMEISEPDARKIVALLDGCCTKQA